VPALPAPPADKIRPLRADVKGVGSPDPTEGAGDVRTTRLVHGRRSREARACGREDEDHGDPDLQTYDGFAGYISLYDEDNNRAKAIILWESKELAETAEETLVDRRAKITAEVGIQVESADLWEAPVVELVGARV